MSRHPQPFFFVHLMKTAGFTLALHLHQEFPGPAIYPASLDTTHVGDFDAKVNIQRLLDLPASRAEQIRCYALHMPYAVARMMEPKPITFTLLRDPVDRTISMLRHFQTGLSVIPNSTTDTRVAPFYAGWPLEAIYDDQDVFRVFVENYQTASFARADFAFADMLRYFTARNETPHPAFPPPLDRDSLRAAKQNLAEVDALGLAEHFDDFLDCLRLRFGFWANGLDRGLRVNASEIQEDVPRSFRARIAQDNCLDIELYEYGRELVVSDSGPSSRA
jgi:hypothetical protein